MEQHTKTLMVAWFCILVFFGLVLREIYFFTISTKTYKTSYGLKSTSSCQLVQETKPCPPTSNDEIPQHRFALKCGNSKINVEIYGEKWLPSQADFQLWVKDAIRSTISYYGKYPIKRTLVQVNQKKGYGIICGSASFDEKNQQGLIEINMGNKTDPAYLADTWTLTHEMVHLSFPLVKDRYNWLTEGIATYAEPIGRMRQGIISREKLWKDLVIGLPKGQPLPGDRGLNRTNTWGRTYWGGAMYCLLADIELRKASNNETGLEQALRCIMNQGGNAESNNLYAPTILALSENTDKHKVLQKLYNRMKDKPVAIDLEKIWYDLGVRVVGTEVHFDDNAPLAHIRKAIETGKTEPRRVSQQVSNSVLDGNLYY